MLSVAIQLLSGVCYSHQLQCRYTISCVAALISCITVLLLSTVCYQLQGCANSYIGASISCLTLFHPLLFSTSVAIGCCADAFSYIAAIFSSGTATFPYLIVDTAINCSAAENKFCCCCLLLVVLLLQLKIVAISCSAAINV